MAHQTTERGARDTPRWTPRLAVAVAISAVLHTVVLAVRAPAMPSSPVDVEINHAVEMGLEDPLPGSAQPPPALATSSSLSPGPTTPPPRPARAPRVVHRSAPPPEPVVPEPGLPEAPELHLHEPSLTTRTPDTPSLLLPDDAAVATADDAGTADDGAAATAVATGTGLPGMASAAPDLAPAVPAGAVVTLLLRADRLRDNPNADRVRDVLQGIPDWQEVLNGTELDPVRDFDTVLLASADPFGDATHPPDLLALVRLHAPQGFVRASVEQMAGARAPMDPDAGTLYARFAPGSDAGALPRTTRPVWRRQGGAEVAMIQRYHGRHAFMLLGGDLAAIAPPERVPALLAVLARRAPAAAAGDRRLVALLQANGVRNLLRARSGPTALPTRADLGVLATRTDGRADGGADLVGVCQYDTPAQAARAEYLFRLVLADTDRALGGFEHSIGGMLAAGAGAVHFAVLHTALQAVHAEAEGSTLRLSATLSAEQVGELLNVQRLVGAMQ